MWSFWGIAETRRLEKFQTDIPKTKKGRTQVSGPFSFGGKPDAIPPCSPRNFQCRVHKHLHLTKIQVRNNFIGI